MKVMVIEIKPYQSKNTSKKLNYTWKISDEYTDEEHEMHLKNDNLEIMICDKADQVIKEKIESVLNKYQIGLETTVRCSELICCIANAMK